jgi:hypothetical protein
MREDSFGGKDLQWIVKPEIKKNYKILCFHSTKFIFLKMNSPD